jgi:hypothetical protein
MNNYRVAESLQHDGKYYLVNEHGCKLSYPADGKFRHYPEPVLFDSLRYARWTAEVVNKSQEVGQ